MTSPSAHPPSSHDRSIHLGVYIERPVRDVYAYAADPARMTEWAPGLGRVEQDGGAWFVHTGDGHRLAIVFAPRNDLGVLDHWVTQPDGSTVYIPLRAIADGDGTEVVFTLRRGPGMTDADVERDAGLVSADLGRLKDILETAR